MTIREFNRSDLEAVIKVDVASYRHQFGGDVSKKEMEFELAGRKAGYEDLRLAKDSSFIACKGNEIVGYIQFGKNRDGSHQIKRIYILPEFQGKGLGRELISSSLKTIGSTKVFIELWKDNYRAASLYLKLGFKETGRKIPYIDHNGELDGYEIEMVLEQ